MTDPAKPDDRASAPRRASPHRRHRSLRTLVAALGLLAASAASEAHQSSTLTIDTLTRRAAVVLDAQVVDVESAWDDTGTRILTRVQLQVHDYYKGDLGQRSVAITLLGGTVGEVTLAVLGQPTFTVGEHAVLFLAPNYWLGAFPLVAGEQGKLEATTDPTSGAPMLRAPEGLSSRAAVLDTIQDIMDAAPPAAHQP